MLPHSQDIQCAADLSRRRTNLRWQRCNKRFVIPCLEAADELQTTQPVMAVRVWEGTLKN